MQKVSQKVFATAVSVVMFFFGFRATAMTHMPQPRKDTVAAYDCPAELWEGTHVGAGITPRYLPDGDHEWVGWKGNYNMAFVVIDDIGAWVDLIPVPNGGWEIPYALPDGAFFTPYVDCNGGLWSYVPEGGDAPRGFCIDTDDSGASRWEVCVPQ